MKFFFDLVSCYWYSSASVREVSAKAEEPRVEETMSLVGVEGRKKRRRKQDYLSAYAKPEWKPSLRAISEEKQLVVVMEKDEDRTVRSGELAKLRGGSRPTRTRTRTRTPSRSRSDCFGGDAVPLVIPAFSPTPFLF